MDDTGLDVIFGKPTAPIPSTEAVVSDGDTPVVFKDRHRSVGDGLNICPRWSGNRVLGAANTKRRINVVRRSQLRPVSRVEVVNLLLVENEAAGIGMQIDGHPPVKAYAAGALGMAAVVALNDVDLNRRPDGVAVEAGFPTSPVRAAASG